MSRIIRLNRAGPLLAAFIAFIGFQSTLLGGATSDPADSVQFDHARGLCSSPFDLKLSPADNRSIIRFTVDGSTPTAGTGELYTQPIHIMTTTVVRAISLNESVPQGSVCNQSYIFPTDVLLQGDALPDYPHPKEPINNPGPNEVDVALTYTMNRKIIEDPQYSAAALAGLSQIPTVSIGVNAKDIFGSSGFYDSPRGKDATKTPISFEYIDPNHPQDNCSVNAGITGHSRPKLKRSFHLHFGQKFGSTSRLHGAIFAHAPFGSSSAATDFTDLILRGGNNRSWATTSAPAKTTYTEDEFVRDTQIAMTGQGVHGEFVHLYINGIYWGLYNLVERPDEGFGEAYFKSKKEDYFSISQNGVASGDESRWDQMIDTLSRENLSVAKNYEQMQTFLNVKQFADYLIGEWFCGVTDWPDSNFWAGGDTANQQPIQFFAWDGEFMMDTVDRLPTIPNGPWVHPYFTKDPQKSRGPIVKLWNGLKRNPDFMMLFTNEVRRNLADDGALSDRNVLARWKTLNDSIRNAIVDESARWGDALTPTGRHIYTKNGDWLNATESITNDLKNADANFLAALRREGYFP